MRFLIARLHVARLARFLPPMHAALYETQQRRVPLKRGGDEVDLEEEEHLALIQEKLPDELLLECFLRMPLRFAARCMVVCKQARQDLFGAVTASEQVCVVP